ncbi:hypothetical protein E2C01_043370 [Portunus trituberculatus]|uniref:Uncharacterized protein n=1 Tax=Portunus trituberculatus TaxID=210409 RepID=A0A5B7FX52_PORTR|nr:hypothetical protein [Portunus trituberculatus]
MLSVKVADFHIPECSLYAPPSLSHPPLCSLRRLHPQETARARQGEGNSRPDAWLANRSEMSTQGIAGKKKGGQNIGRKEMVTTIAYSGNHLAYFL